MPHELNGLTKSNKKVMYKLLFDSVWATIQETYTDKANVGGKAGMVAVLHTWGSDIKYHVHIHCLLTFGGLDKDNVWVSPKRKKTIGSFYKISKTYKRIFLANLKLAYKKGAISFRNDYNYYEELLKEKRWVINQQPPQVDTKILEEYLSRYICRSAISPSRLKYVKDEKKVEISFKDYRNQQKGVPAPIAIKRLDPLLVIHMILQHKLPPYFHRCRYYGLHATCNKKKIKKLIPKALLRNEKWIKQLFELLTILFNLTVEETKSCPDCGSINLVKIDLSIDNKWAANNIKYYKKTKNKDPTKPFKHTKHNKRA
jgi:hypothetical protein